MLRDVLAPHLSLRVILNPNRQTADLPLKSYYKYATPGVAGEAFLNDADPPRVHFTQLPVGAEVQADCICIVYLSVPVCVIEGGGASSTLA